MTTSSNLKAIACAATLLTGALLPHTASATLYGTTGSGDTPSSLYTIDPTTGAATLIGAIGFSGVNSIDFDPVTGILYGIANVGRSIIKIDTTTGAGTYVSTLSPGFQSPDMTFSPTTGILYSWSEASPDNLNRVNVATGVATEVGYNGIGAFTAQTGLDANSAGVIYMKNYDGNVYTVSTTTGLVSFVVDIDPSGFSFDNILAFDSSDTPYTVDRTGGTSFLYKFDLTTGGTTLIGNTGLARLSALAFTNPAGVPDAGASTLSLFGLALAALGLARRTSRGN